MKRLYQNKLAYQKALHTYEKRRETTREMLSRQTIHINKLKRALRDIANTERKLEKIFKVVHDFTGVTKKQMACAGSNQEWRDAKNLYYAYGIDNGLTSPQLVKFIGLKHKPAAFIQRAVFKKSFATNEYNYNLWRRFMQYTKTHNYDNTTNQPLSRAQIPADVHSGNHPERAALQTA